MKIFKKLTAYLKLRKAIIMAEEEHVKTGNRYYVAPSEHKGRIVLLIVDKHEFKKLKRKHYIDRKANLHDLENECVYCTAYADGKRALSEEVKIAKKERYYYECGAI